MISLSCPATFPAGLLWFIIQKFGPEASLYLLVIKKDGFVVILEPSTPEIFPLKQIFKFYFNTILPKIGMLLSDDKSAYTYLPNSVKNFPNGKEFIKILDNIGFRKTSYFPLTFGIVSLYVAIK